MFVESDGAKFEAHILTIRCTQSVGWEFLEDCPFGGNAPNLNRPM